MNIKKSCCVIAILLLINVMASSVVFAEITNKPIATGAKPYSELKVATVIIGNLAFDLNYANNLANENEITQAVANSNGEVYVIDFVFRIVDNNTNQIIKGTDPRVYGKLVKYKGYTNNSIPYDAYIVEPASN